MDAVGGLVQFDELIELDKNKVESEIGRMVRETGCRPDWRYRLAPIEDSLRHVRARIGSEARSLVSRASR
jgi:hypothetical protein